MNIDMNKNNSKIAKEEWIIATLRALNNQEPEVLKLSESHFKILESQIEIDPNVEITAY
jgi:hypothetical protein